MRASTTLLLCVLVALIMPVAASADGLPRVGIAPLAHEVPNVRTGLAQLFARQLTGNGRMRLVPVSRLESVLESKVAIERAFSEGLSPVQADQLASEMDYLLLGRVSAFGLAGKDKPVDHSRDLNDLGRVVGGDSEVAQAWFDLRLIELSSGSVVLDVQVEGLESRKGTRLKQISYGWLGTADLSTDSFRRTTLGRATYKAIGSFLYELYPHFPLRGEVLAVSGSSVVIDLDQRAGLKPGDELEIFARADILSSLGQVVYRREERVGGALVVELQHGRCLCQLLDGADTVREGDLARPLEERWVLPEETEPRL